MVVPFVGFTRHRVGYNGRPPEPKPVLGVEDFMNRFNTAFTACIVTCLLGLTGPVSALDLLPDFFKEEKVNATIWDLNEQYVQLVEIEKGADKNDHPVVLDKIEIDQALASLQLWIEVKRSPSPSRSAIRPKAPVAVKR